MFYSLMSLFVLLIGALLIYFALRLLGRRHWLLGFVRGLFGLGLLVGAIFLGLFALDLFSYQTLLKEKPVATLSFKQQGPQEFRVTLVHTNGDEEEFLLKGDQWQLDARIIKWQGLVAATGVKPGYRLDRISGRYYSLADERTAERTVYELSDHEWRVDVWQWLHKHPNLVPMVDANYGSATFVPMADNALFEVKLSNTGLVARPLNDPARAALAVWNE